METKFTKAPWRKAGDGSVVIIDTPRQAERIIIVQKRPLYTPISETPEHESEANAHLIAAAPNGHQAACIAYLDILRLDYDIRMNMQVALCLLRDFIAKAENREPESVQSEYEAKARGES